MRINLYVPQGLGDIIWVYQKFALLFDKINFGICTTVDDSLVEKRSLKWIQLLPKVEEIFFYNVRAFYYDKLLKGKYDIAKILEQHKAHPTNKYFYSCNAYLEEGTRLDQIDKYPVLKEINFPLKKIELEWVNYVVLYASGTIIKWEAEKYIELIKKCTKLPVYVIGAGFDQEMVFKLCGLLDKEGISNKFFIDLEPEEVCYLLKNSKCYIGYQSGLNIVADKLGVKQLMLYETCLDKLRFTWNNNKYYTAFFTQDIDSIVNSLPEDFIDMRIPLN